MDIPIFLVHLDPAGVKTYIELNRYAQRSVFYLPNTLSQDLSLSRDQDDLHSTTKLEIEADYSLLSDFGNTPGSTIVLGADSIELPLSTPTHQKSIILTQEHQFITPVGRWQMEWDTANQIPNSMRPPALPLAIAAEEDFDDSEIEGIPMLVPLQHGGGLVNVQELAESPEVEEHEPVPITEIHLSPASSDACESVREHIESGSPTNNQKEHTALAEQTGPNASDSPRQLNESISKSSNTSDTNVWAEQAQSYKPRDSALVSVDVEMLDCIVGEHEAFEPQTIPKASREQQEVAMSEINPTLIGIEAVVPLSDIVPKRRNKSAMQVNAPNHFCVQEMKSAANDQDDEETASEDDSHSHQDHRRLKRSLREIEEGDSPLKRKKARIDETVLQTQDQEERGLGDDTLDSTARFESSVNTTVKKTVSWDDLGTRDQHVPTPRDRGLQGSASPSRPEPTSSISSRTRSVTPVKSLTSTAVDHAYSRPKVIFASTSTIPRNKKIISVIVKLGGSVVSDINEADVLCVGKGSIKKTSKFVIAVSKGKDIVTDDWLKQTYADQKFASRQPFLPKDKQHEKEWKFKLDEAIARGKRGLNLLEGVHVHLTSQLRQDLGDLSKELKQVAIALGASATPNGLPKKNAKGKALVIGSSKNIDPDAANVGRLGYRLYGQDILTMAAFRGRLELDSSEFILDVPVKEETNSD